MKKGVDNGRPGHGLRVVDESVIRERQTEVVSPEENCEITDRMTRMMEIRFAQKFGDRLTKLGLVHVKDYQGLRDVLRACVCHVSGFDKNVGRSKVFVPSFEQDDLLSQLDGEPEEMKKLCLKMLENLSVAYVTLDNLTKGE